MKKFIIDIERDNVRTIGFNKDGNINFYEAGIDGLTNEEEIREVLEEMHGEDPVTGEEVEIIVEFE